MPIYEYLCLSCNGRFSHLARRFDQPPPPCPGCGAGEVKKLLSRVQIGRSEADRQMQFGQQAQQIAADDLEGSARLLKNAGELAETLAPINQELFQELLDRRLKGVQDNDMEDINQEVPFPGAGQTYGNHSHSHPKELGWA